ncbi:MAG: hypothetical protein RIC15_11815 [Vicingaceae bacterium]
MIRIFLFALTLCFFSVAVSQDTNYVDPNYQAKKQKEPKKSSSLKDKMYVGGTFGVSLGSYSSSVLIEPMVGFKMTEKLSTGIGIGYRWGQGSYTNGGKFTYNNYLGRLFSRYIIILKVYAHVEYMVESYDKIFQFESQNPLVKNNSRTAVPFLFVGGGFRSQAGRGSFIVQVLFNVLQNNPNSAEIYPSGFPYISIGYIGGF